MPLGATHETVVAELHEVVPQGWLGIEADAVLSCTPKFKPEIVICVPSSCEAMALTELSSVGTGASKLNITPAVPTTLLRVSAVNDLPGLYGSGMPPLAREAPEMMPALQYSEVSDCHEVLAHSALSSG